LFYFAASCSADTVFNGTNTSDGDVNSFLITVITAGDFTADSLGDGGLQQQFAGGRRSRSPLQWEPLRWANLFLSM
jgi:hypothetical protein